ncbi:hypothetical protein [Mucilaginibacter terrae]|uniref:Uncharacterized protein n=1 Tax=Mucilaginibacter terrae TaxID=1955052 RepID=A0ABU3GZG6_9SPHI|nr:hypothetical protein [Mucilaginibacter terrae]MDT3405168.1 hypothetical protein [Mucilaginibacter terrae]
MFVKHFLEVLVLTAILVYAFYEITGIDPNPVLILLITFPFFLTYYFSAQSNKSIVPRKGLTTEDLQNINFIKAWQETQGMGFWRYLLVDGAIIFGALMSLYTSAFSGYIFNNDLSSPSKMFELIGESYLTGAIIATCCHYILWKYNERRFDRLTNPIL